MTGLLKRLRNRYRTYILSDTDILHWAYLQERFGVEDWAGGAILSFEVKGGRAEAWRVVDGCKLLSITANLGDTKTTITHPASTTHSQLTEVQQLAAGVSPSFIRLSIGIENIEDIITDLDQALSA